VPADGTAFGIRDTHFVVEIVAAWEDNDPKPHEAWADAVSAALAPHALPGGYANLLRSDANEQIAHAFGDNAARLRAVKSQYDPDGVFAAIPLPTQTKAD
jgi:FAD/FMN-containing dehydrogenase